MWTLIQNWRVSIWVIGIPLLAGIVGHFFVYGLIRKITQKSHNKIDDSLARHLYKPLQWLLIAFIIYLGLGFLRCKTFISPDSHRINFMALYQGGLCVRRIRNRTL